MTDEQRDSGERVEGGGGSPNAVEIDSVQSPSQFLQDSEKSLWRGKPVSSMTRDELIVALHEMSDLYLDELKSRRWYGTLNCAGHHSPACRCIHCLEFE